MTERRRRRAYGRRVETAVLQLLGRGGLGEDACPDPEDPLHVGLAARLALAVAGQADGALLLSQARNTERVEKQRRLLREAVRTVRGWSPADAAEFVSSEVDLPVRCNGKAHVLRLAADGSLSLPAHPAVDLASEQLAAALGAELMPCAAAVVAAQYRARPAVADDGARMEFIGAAALASFLGLVRRWLVQGYDVRASAPAVSLGIEPAHLTPLLAAGLDVADAVSWQHASPAEVLRWRARGFTATASETWLHQGRTLDELEALQVGADEGPWVTRWARLAGRALTSDAVVEWARFGAPVGVWGELASRGLRAAEAPAWTAAGFQPVEVLRFVHLRVPLDDAVAWRRQGFTGLVAAGCLGVGMTLADACALRGLPARQVQEAWREHPSIDVVRRMVEAAEDAANGLSRVSSTTGTA